MLSFLDSSSQMAGRVRHYDWARHLLGAPEQWPISLKTLAGIVLEAQQPMFVVWGESRTLIYNDAYAIHLGQKHPAALGLPILDVWSEIASDIAPIIERVYQGHPIHMPQFALKLERHGYLEEAHFSFSYTPVHGPDKSTLGFLCVTHEITDQVFAVRALHESESRTRQIFDSVTESAIIVTDLDGLITGWNIGAERLFGWSSNEMCGQSLDRIYTAADREQGFPASEMTAVVMKSAQADERWYGNRAGDFFWASSEITLLQNDDKSIVGFVKVLRDRTLQRQHEKRIATSEATLRETANAVPGFLWTADARGFFDYTSHRWQSYSGSLPEQSTGNGWLSYVHPDDRDFVTARWKYSQHTQTGFETELRLRDRDMVYRWWLARAQPVFDDTHTLVRWVGACTDIDEIVEARETLARSREDLEARVAERTRDRDRIWRLSTDVMLVAKFDARIKAANPAWTSTFGWDPSEMIDQSFFDWVHPDDLAVTRAEVEQLAQGKTTLRFENRLRHKNGQYRWLSWTAVPDERFIHAVGRDVQAEKEAAEQLRQTEEALRQSQKMEAVGQLTGGIAHDFNNLLAGVTGSLELLQIRIAQGRHSEADRYISAAQGAARRAASLTQRLLAYSRRQTLEPAPTNINQMVAGMEELIRRTVGPEIAVETVAAGGLWATLIDHHQLENTLLNLCINARDAMPSGGRLTIETGNRWLDEQAAIIRDIPAGQYVTLSVSDNGTGMSEEVAARAFDPFFTTKPIGQGTGLGLSMIYGFVKQTGGQVRIYSEMGQGTMVCLYLPRHYGDAVDISTSTSHLPPQLPGDNETVLVVDDEPTVRMLVVDVLQELGYVAIEASDGPSGLKILQSDAHIDLLVTDVGLPGGLNGRQLAEMARASRPDLKVLFITGYAENAVINHGHLAPGMHILTKPFSMDALVHRVKQVLNFKKTGP